MRAVFLSSLALSVSSPAWACGGFFCDNSAPVLQAQERIVFAVDEDAGEVDVQVSIAYEGPSESFAWVVPVPAQPTLYTSSDELLTTLAALTQPSYRLDQVYDGDCLVWEVALSASPTLDGGSSYGVLVVDSGRVGPYETVTLQADSSAALVTWLQDNGFDLPSSLDPKLAPYVSSGMYFVALKLAKDADVGDLVPLGMRYPGSGISVPIQLTAVAALPDMRLEVYVFGASRAVPESYLHVVPNDLAVDWFDQTVAYEDVVSLAADEAGGQAFATDFSGSTEPLRGTLYQEGRYDLAALAAAPDAVAWMDQITGQGFSPTAALQEVLRIWLPLPPALAAQGVSETDWWNCLACYPDYSGSFPFDAVAATADLEARVIQPLVDAEALLAAYPHLTRLTSSLDAVEMTVDPSFVWNAEMAQDVSPVHVATVTYHCQAQMDPAEAPRTVAFPGGYSVSLPSEADLQAQGISEYEYLQSLTAINALVIEDTTSSGEAVTIYDGRSDLAALVDALNQTFVQEAGCGCDQGGAGAMPVGALVGLALLARRRR